MSAPGHSAGAIPPDPATYDPVIFDLIGQCAFANLGPDPFAAQLAELGLAPTVYATWKDFGKQCRANVRPQSTPSSSARIDAVVFTKRPDVRDPETSLWWEEFINEPTQETWSSLLSGTHSSQTQRSTQRQDASPVRNPSSIRQSPFKQTSTSSKRHPNSQIPDNTQSHSVETPLDAPSGRPKPRKAAKTTQQDTDEDDTSFYDRSGQRSTRKRSAPIHLSDFEVEGDEPLAKRRASGRRGSAQAQLQGKGKGSKNGKGKGKAKASRQITPSRPAKAARPMTAQELREQRAAMQGRAAESDLDDDEFDDADAEPNDDEGYAIDDDGDDDFDMYVPPASRLERDSSTDEDVHLPSPTRVLSTSARAGPSSSRNNTTRAATQAGAAKTDEAGAARKSGKSTQGGHRPIVNVDDIVDDEEKEDTGRPKTGVGSRGSKYWKYFMPKPISAEERWHYPRNGGQKRRVLVELYRCSLCHQDVSVKESAPSSLALHFNASHRGCCKRKLNPIDPRWRGEFGPYQPKPKQPAEKAKSAVTSVANPSNASLAGGAIDTRRMDGWLEAHRRATESSHISIVRRTAAEWLVIDALPFTTLRTQAFQRLVFSLNPAAVPAFMSARQVQRDIDQISLDLQAQAVSSVIKNKFSIQLDAWTTPGMQHAFQAVVVSFIDDDWNYHSFCIDFCVLRGRHSGATFSGLLIDFLLENDLLTSWNKTLVTDSASSNVRMGSLIAQRLAKNHEQEAFPHTQNHARCFAHHLNLVVKDLYVALGVPAEDGGRRKIIKDNSGGAASDPGPNLTDPKRRLKLMAGLGSGTEEEAYSSDDFDGTDEDEDRQEDGTGQAGKEPHEDPVGLGPGDDTLDGLEGEEQDEARLLAEDLAPSSFLERLPTIPEDDEDDGEAEEVMEPVDGAADEPTSAEAGSQADTGTTPTRASDAQRGTGASSAPPVMSPLVKIAKIVSVARSSPERRRRFLRVARAAYQDNAAKQKAVRIPSAYNKTRWNSRFFQLRTALRFAKALAQVVRTDVLDSSGEYGAELDLKSDELTLLRRALRILGYIMLLTKEAEERGPTAASVLYAHARLARALKAEVQQARKLDSAIGDFFAKALERAAAKQDTYRQQAARCDPLLLAAILHPRHRQKMLLRDYPQQAERAKKLLQEEVAKIVGTKDIPEMKTPGRKAVELDIWRASDESEPEDEAAAGEDELTAYLAFRFKMESSEQTVLQWWKANAVNFPTIAKVAREWLAMPGATSEVERVFSAAGRFCSARRRSLTPSSLRSLIICHQLLKAGFNAHLAPNPIPATPLITPA